MRSTRHTRRGLDTRRGCDSIGIPPERIVPSPGTYQCTAPPAPGRLSLLEESMLRVRSRALVASLTLGVVFAAAVPAFAGICFTSGKVYVQQKVWDKAAVQLECA